MHWVFQYRPAEYDLAQRTREKLTDWWAMNRGQRLVAAGDEIYFLRSGPLAAITARGTVTRATYGRHTHRGEAAVDIVMNSFVDPELRRADMASDAILKSAYVLSSGIQGTNFQLSLLQAEALDALLSERLRDATPGGAPESLPVLERSQTALAGSLEAIKIAEERVVAVQVQFYADPGQDGAYCDRRLDGEDILLIGRGKREKGDQKLTHGNALLESQTKRVTARPFPVYEKVAARSYVYLGEYVAVDASYFELVDGVLGYKVYRFRLSPWHEPELIPFGEQNVQADFVTDVCNELPPERRQLVRAIIARNRSRVARIKRNSGNRCERCSKATCWTSQGVPYVEVHHIIALGENGFDNERNMIALCSDCHRYLHFGDDRTAETLRLRAARGL